jgi:hypothetical protein
MGNGGKDFHPFVVRQPRMVSSFKMEGWLMANRRMANGEEEFSFFAYEQRYRDRMLHNLKKKAQAFGLELIPISDSTECVS